MVRRVNPFSCVTVSALGLFLACIPGCGKAASKPVTSATVSASADPEPEFHPHPGVAPDEISTRSEEPQTDAGGNSSVPPEPSAECKATETPPPAPKVRKRIYSGPPMTNRIPPEIVQGPVRTRAACFRACYERGLVANANLAGRVEIKFVIDEDGWVRRSTMWKTDVPDETVADCLAKEFVGLSFPPPVGDKVTVVYPLTLVPGSFSTNAHESAGKGNP